MARSEPCQLLWPRNRIATTASVFDENALRIGVALAEPSAAQKIQIERLGGTQVVAGRKLLDTDPLMDGAHFPAPAMRPETPFQVTKVIYTETGDLE